MIRHDAAAHRFEAYLEEFLAGFAEYSVEGEVWNFFRTVVADEFAGQGVGSQLVAAAVAKVRAQGQLRVRADCWFVAGWLRRHPEWCDLWVDC